MNFDWRFWELFTNPALASALIAMGGAQVFKVFAPIFRGKRPDFKRIAHFGGMPSGHTSFIVAAAVATGFAEGWKSPLFALAAVMASLVIHDILKLRPAVEVSLDAAKQLAERGGVKLDREIPQFKGHTVAEVAVGVLWGIACAAAVCWLFSKFTGGEG